MFCHLLFILCFSSSQLEDNHAIYLSTVEVESNLVSVKVFSDDLLDALRNYSGSSKVSIEDRSMIHAYFNENLKLRINQIDQQLKLKEVKMEGDATFLHFSFASDSEWTSLSLEADYFMELFPNQSNVVTLHHKGEKYFSRLTKSKPTYYFTLD